MSDGSEIKLIVDATSGTTSAINDVVDQLSRGIAAAGELEAKLKQVQSAASFRKQSSGTVGPMQMASAENMKAISMVQAALSGMFDTPALKLAALQGKIKELQAQTVNLNAALINSQGRIQRGVTNAQREAQIQGFMGKNGNRYWEKDQDNPDVLKARIEAEQRLQAQRIISGQKVSEASQRNLAGMQAQLARLEASQKRVNSATQEAVRLEERLGALTTQYASRRIAGDTMGKFQTLTQIAQTKSNLALARDGGTSSSYLNAFTRSDNLDTAYKNFQFSQRDTRADAEAENRQRDQAAKAAAAEQARAEQQAAAERQAIMRYEAEAENAQFDKAKANQEKLLATQLAGDRAINAVEEQQAVVQRAKLALAAELAASGGQYTAAVRQANEALGEQNRLLKQAQLAQQANDRFARTNSALSSNHGADAFLAESHVLVNYQIFNALTEAVRGSVEAIVRYQDEMNQVRLISQSTDTEMDKLSKQFLDLASNSRYSTEEIATAGRSLAEAGFSAEKIAPAIESITKLALATGTTLPEATHLSIAAMSAFDLRVGELKGATDFMTGALNTSRLDYDRLTHGIEEAGDVAAQSGISFQELTTALAAVSNAGVRSGQALGPGMREVINALVNPNAKMVKVLKDLGLSMEDINIRSQGFTGALKNLKDAGITYGQAMEVMGLRGANAFVALVKSADTLPQQQAAIAAAGNAIRQSAESLNSIEGQWDRLKATGSALAIQTSGPLSAAFQELLTVTANLLEGLTNLGPALSVVTTAIGGTATLALTKWVAQMAFAASGLGKLTAASKVAAVATTELTAAQEAGAAAEALFADGALAAAPAIETSAVAATGATEGLAALGTALVATLGPWGLIAAAIAAAAAAYEFFGSRSRGAAADIEATQTSINETKTKIDDYGDALDEVSKSLDTLALKHKHLASGGPELSQVIADLNSKFKDMGLYLKDDGTGIDGLRQKLLQFQDTLSLAQKGQISLQLINNQAQGQQLTVAQNSQFGGNNIGLNSLSSQILPSRSTLTGDRATLADQYKNVRSLLSSVPTNNDDFFAKGTAQEQALGNLQNTTTDPAVKDLAKKVSDLLAAAMASVVDVANNKVNALNLQQQAAANDASRSPQAKALQDLSNRILQQVSQTTLPANASDTNRHTYADMLQGEYQSSSNALTKITSGLTPEQLALMGDAVTGVTNSLQQLKDKAEAAGASTQAIDKAQIELQQKLLDLQLQSVSSDARGKFTTSGQVGADRERGIGIINQQRANALQLAKDNKAAGTDGPDDNAAVINATYDQRIQDFLAPFADAAKNATHAMADLGKALAKIVTPADSIGLKFKDLDDNLKAAKDVAQAPVRLQEGVVARMQSPEHKGDYSDADVEMAQKKLEELKKTAAKEEAKSIQSVVDLYQDLADTATAQAAALDAKARSEQVKARGLNGQAQTDMINASKEDEKNSNDLLAKIKDLQEKVAQLQQEVADAKPVGGSDQAGPTPSVGQSIGNSWRAFSTPGPGQSSMLESQSKIWGDGTTSVLDSTQSGLLDYLMKVEVHSRGAKQAFKDFELSTVQSLLKVSTQAAMSSLFKGGLSLLSGIGGKSTAGGTSGGTTTTGGIAGFIGGLFGGSKAGTPGTSKTNPMYTVSVDGMPGVPSTPTGAASSSTGSTGIFGGLMSTLTSMFKGIGSEITSIFSGVGSIIKSLFSGGGGSGGGSTTSGIAGLIGQVASSYSGSWNGGVVHRSLGGEVPGSMTTRDSVPMLLAPGEGVLNQSAMKSIGSDGLSRLNSYGAAGIAGVTNVVHNMPQRKPDLVNVYVGHADQAPIPGPKDFVMAVSQDLIQRGTTRNLVKQIAIGQG